MLRIAIVYICLFTIAIPWYWPEEESRLLLGFPVWVSVSIFCSVFIAAFTAYLLLKFPWPGESED